MDKKIYILGTLVLFMMQMSGFTAVLMGKLGLVDFLKYFSFQFFGFLILVVLTKKLDNYLIDCCWTILGEFNIMRIKEKYFASIMR